MQSRYKVFVRCVFQTLLLCLVHLLSVYICLNQDSGDLFVLFFKKLYSFSFYLYVYILSWIHFSMWVETEARIFLEGYSVVASSFVEDCFPGWILLTLLSKSVHLYMCVFLDLILYWSKCITSDKDHTASTAETLQ